MNSTINLRHLTQRSIVLYPQNGDRIVTSLRILSVPKNTCNCLDELLHGASSVVVGCHLWSGPVRVVEFGAYELRYGILFYARSKADKLTHVGFRALVKIASRIVSHRKRQIPLHGPDQRQRGLRQSGRVGLVEFGRKGLQQIRRIIGSS